MELFIINNRALSAKITGRIKSGPAYVAETCNVLFNCIERAIMHNDATWLNKGAAYARASGPYVTAYMKVAKTVAPFKFENGEFGGKILKNKRDKWRKVDADNHGDYRDEQWFKFLSQEFDAMLKDRTEATAKKQAEFDMAKWLKNVLNKAEKEQCLDALYAAVVAKKNVPVQEVAEGIEEERKEERKAA